MDANSLNQWLSLGANIGVLAGIFLLIFEIRQNRQAIRAQTRNDLAQGAISLISLAVENPHVADIIVRSNRGEDLTETENYILFSRAESYFRYFENVHYQYRIGAYDEAEFSRHMDTMRITTANTASLRQFWSEYSSMFSEEFEKAANEVFGVEYCQ
jgi:hypothetical protein